MRKIKRHTKEKLYTHIEAWKISIQTQKFYCGQAGLAIATFQYWAKKYREELSQDEAKSTAIPGFIPLEVQSEAEEDQSGISNQLHFLFPNGIQVMCPAGVQPELLRTLLNQ